MKKRFNPIFYLFPTIQIFIYLLFIFAGSATYLYLTTKNVYLSVILGIITMFFGFHYLVYLPKKLEREQFLLKELQKYATSMAFYMQSGHNVLNSLNLSRERLDKEIKKDIEKTMINIQEKTICETSHFEKYNFVFLDIFHEILKIKYTVGGDAKELFSSVNESINFELVKRDELYRRKNQIKNRVLFMMAMVLSMPLIFVFTSSELYDQFLSVGFLSVGLIVVLFIASLISLYFLQKTTIDISI